VRLSKELVTVDERYLEVRKVSVEAPQ